MIPTTEGASLSVSLKAIPELPKSPALYPTNFGGSSSVENYGSLFLFASLMAIFVITLVKVMGEKTSNMLSALRTAGLYESLYWISW